jgi:AraC family transcriptional regulator
MHSLTKGTYTGRLDKSICDGNIFACMTFYEDEAKHKTMHYHENPHISLVLNGGCIVKKREATYELLPGQSTFNKAGEYHQFTNVLPSLIVNLEIEEDFLLCHGLSQNIYDELLHHNPDTRFMMLNVGKELNAADTFSVASIQMLLLGLIKTTKSQRKKEAYPDWLNTINAILQDCWNEPLTLQDLAIAAGVHPVTISKNFPKYFSCTLGAYMRKLKIEKALILIKSTKKSLTEIAFDCGFADQSHFTRTFKQLTGYLPHDYKRL